MTQFPKRILVPSSKISTYPLGTKQSPSLALYCFNALIHKSHESLSLPSTWLNISCISCTYPVTKNVSILIKQELLLSLSLLSFSFATASLISRNNPVPCCTELKLFTASIITGVFVLLASIARPICCNQTILLLVGRNSKTPDIFFKCKPSFSIFTQNNNFKLWLLSSQNSLYSLFFPSYDECTTYEWIFLNPATLNHSITVSLILSRCFLFLQNTIYFPSLSLICLLRIIGIPYDFSICSLIELIFL